VSPTLARSTVTRLVADKAYVRSDVFGLVIGLAPPPAAAASTAEYRVKVKVPP